MANINMEDIAEILSIINSALIGTGYKVSGFDNTGKELCIRIDRQEGE